MERYGLVLKLPLNISQLYCRRNPGISCNFFENLVVVWAIWAFGLWWGRPRSLQVPVGSVHMLFMASLQFITTCEFSIVSRPHTQWCICSHWHRGVILLLAGYSSRWSEADVCIYVCYVTFCTGRSKVRWQQFQAARATSLASVCPV